MTLVQCQRSLKIIFSIRTFKPTFLRLRHFLKLTRRVPPKKQPRSGYTHTKLSQAFGVRRDCKTYLPTESTMQLGTQSKTLHLSNCFAESAHLSHTKNQVVWIQSGALASTSPEKERQEVCHKAR